MLGDEPNGRAKRRIERFQLTNSVDEMAINRSM
jgi:hypothetical protein